ncbi:MAG: retropepsin-like aspartic protease [Steroidobacteraceae bacterium]
MAPTRRDRIGRIWAPVMINGQGPFRLVLDSGASSSGITPQVATMLGLPLDGTRHVLLRGVVGLATVPLVRVHSFTAGDLSFGTRDLPIVTDALGGADGILGTDGMSGRRILIDFHHDLITIARSHDQRAPQGYITIPFRMLRRRLIDVDAYVGNVHAQAIIDTGGQTTIANLALRTALEHRRAQLQSQPDEIEDVTRAVQPGASANVPPIVIGTQLAGGSVKISNDRMTFGDMHIFEHWHMVNEPAMLIGMDTLGRLDILIIDYRRHELQIRLNDSGSEE